jgi:drug/metabolite transporter (DMT)-like permease
MKRAETIALVEAALAILIWGSSFIFIKIALREISPVTLIILRFALGALILGAAAWGRGDFVRLSRADLPGLALLGAVGITLQQLLQVSGQASADASVAVFLAATAPAFTVLLAAIILRERLRLWQVLGVGLATVGAVAVGTNGDVASVWRGQFGAPGNFLVLLSAAVWAAFTILNKRMVHNRPPALVTGAMFFFGWLFALPVFVAQKGWREIPNLSPTGWAMALGIGAVCSAFAYLINSHALQHVPASRVAVIQNLEPISAVIGAALVLKETITLPMLMGGAAILIGVYLAERAAPSAEQIKPPDAEAVAGLSLGDAD